LSSVIGGRSALTESVAVHAGPLQSSDGSPFDLVIYAMPADARGLRELLVGFPDGAACPRLAIIANAGDISAIGPALETGPVIVMRRPVERIDLSNLLTLIAN
jgi:hypothetical protein